jgi:hypothetical protein
MDTNSHNSHPAMNPEVGYDHSDLSVRGIIIFLVGVGAAGVIAHLIIWALFVGAKRFTPYAENPNPMAASETLQAAPPLQNAGPQSTVKFPEPRLQADDTADMSKFKLQEDMDLYPSEPYQKDGAIHININDAMKLIVQRGLPTRQAPSGSQTQTQAKPSAPGAPKASAGMAGAK